MKTIRSQFPAHLIEDYWRRVEQLLVDTHHVTPDNAKVGIERYRETMADGRVGDILYHNSIEVTAQGIKAGYLP